MSTHAASASSAISTQSAAKFSSVRKLNATSTSSAASSATSTSDAVPHKEPPYRVLFSRAAASPATLEKIDNAQTRRENAMTGATSQTFIDNNVPQRALKQESAPDVALGENRARSVSQQRPNTPQQLGTQRNAVAQQNSNTQQHEAAHKEAAHKVATTSRTTDSQGAPLQSQQLPVQEIAARDVAVKRSTSASGANASGANASGANASGASASGANASDFNGAISGASSARTVGKAANASAAYAQATQSQAASDEGEGALNADRAARGGAPLRVSGAIVVSESEAVGAPVGTVGVASVLPDGPILEVRLVAGRNVRFTTPTLRAEFIGALDVRGTPRNPNINGRISTRDGQIRFPNAPARISEGEVAVSVSRDPLTDLIRSRVEIEATARGTVGRYRITVAVKGPLDFGSQGTQNLRVDVSSDPPLSQDEAFAQLTGTSVRDFQDAGNGKTRIGAANEAYARAVVSLLSAPLFAGIERSLEEALGLSSITLDYRFSEPLSVQLGKAVGDRVYITYRRTLSSTVPGQPTAFSLRVDYRIKGGLLLGVQTDERGRRQLTLDRTFRF